MKNNQIIALASAISLVLSITACSNNPPDTDSATESTVTAAAVTTASAAEASVTAASDDPDTTLPVTETFDGMILEVNDRSIVTNKLVSEDLGNGLYGMGEEEGATVTVTFDDNTTFFCREITDNGLDSSASTNTSASVTDLQSDQMVHMTGIYAGDVFKASEIMIYIFK